MTTEKQIVLAGETIDAEVTSLKERKFSVRFTTAGPVMAEIISDDDVLSATMEEALRKNLFTFKEAKEFIAHWFETRAKWVRDLTEINYDKISNKIAEENTLQREGKFEHMP